MAGRTIAIGDIHGCLAALTTLIDAIDPGPEDTLITLGDHIDRGPDSRGVLDRLISLAERCEVVPLMGDHEEMLVDALQNITALKRWLTCGGSETLRSYGWILGTSRRPLTDWIPEAHRGFLVGCRSYHETERHFFVHAGFLPELKLEEQPGQALRWRVTDSKTAIPHHSGKVAVVGHTPQLAGEVLDLNFLVCIDTNCVRGGWLTGFEINTGQVWQADKAGKLRSGGNCFVSNPVNAG
jgi:serine/threonine protein phosphatase 1